MNESSPVSVFYQIIQALGFQDLSSFVLALVFVLAACAFVVSALIFLFKKHAERRESLEHIVREVQESAKEEALKPELEEKPEQLLKPKPEPALKPEQALKPKLEPALKPEQVLKPKLEPALKPEQALKPKLEPALKPEQVLKPKLEQEIKLEQEEKALEPKIESKKSLGAALRNTRGGFIEKITRLFSQKGEISDEDFEAMEAILFTADIGAKTAEKLLNNLKARVRAEKISDKAHIQAALKEEMLAILKSIKAPVIASEAPRVFMFVGVNGAGKTTTIAKLGAKLAHEGKKVIFAAGDTFRAAAVEQLSIWGERAGIAVVSGKVGADSASVLFEAVTQAKRDQLDAVLCDTAGRLHTKVELMDELKKVYRVVNKAHVGAPHEVFLVIDATMGQNALAQAREFALATPLTGVVLSKLDGTAKGGVALGIVDELKVPIRFIGIGEQAGDLRDFDAHDFVNALFEENSN